MFVIFDWDGTLCDSLNKIVSSLQFACKACDAPLLTRELYQSVIGLGLQEAFVTLYPDFSQQRILGLMASYREHYVAADKRTPSRLYPAALSVLQTLLDRGHILAVATGKRRAGLDRVMQQTDTAAFFSHTRCADETRSKPHPMMLEELLDEARATATQSIMIGDTDFDIKMGKAAGMRTIAIKGGAQHPERVALAEPDFFLDNLKELLNLELLR